MSIKKNTLTYLISNIINASIPFLLLPILTRYLTPEEYGQVAMFQVLTAGLLGFVGFNTVGAAARKYFDKCNRNEIKIYNFNCFYVLFFSSLFLFFLILIFGGDIAEKLSIPYQWLHFALVFSIATFFIQFRLTQWQIRESSKSYALLQVSYSLVNFMFSLFFVAFLMKGGEGRVLSIVISALIMAAFSYCYLMKSRVMIISKLNVKYIKESLSFGLPLVPHVFGMFLLSSIDRVFITKDIGLKEAGIYMIAFQLSLGLQVVFDAINKAYTPYLYKKLKENSKQEKLKIVRATYAYFIALMFLAMLGFLLGPLFITLISTKEYYQAKDVIGFLILGQVFNGMYLMVTNYVFYSKDTLQLSLVTITSGLINIALLIVFIPLYELQGAAYAFCISTCIRFVLTWLLACYKVDMPWTTLRVK